MIFTDLPFISVYQFSYVAAYFPSTRASNSSWFQMLFGNSSKEPFSHDTMHVGSPSPQSGELSKISILSHTLKS